MRTLQGYLDWMRSLRELDPDCTHRMNFDARGFNLDGIDFDRVPDDMKNVVPETPSDVERRYLEKGELFELGNSGIYLASNLGVLDEIVRAYGFLPDGERQTSGLHTNRNNPKSVNCDRQKYTIRDERGYADITLFESKDGSVISGSLVPECELQPEEMRAEFGYPLDMEFKPSQGADLDFNCMIIFGYARSSQRDGNTGRYPWAEYHRRTAMLERDLFQPILEEVLERNIPAILHAKGRRVPHYNLVE